MDQVTDKIIQKYETAMCEQLYQERAKKKQPTQEEERAIQFAEQLSADAPRHLLTKLRTKNLLYLTTKQVQWLEGK